MSTVVALSEMDTLPFVGYVPSLQDAPHYVYRYYDRTGELLYVGCSYRIARRDYQHQRKSPWYADVDRIEYDIFPNRAEGFGAEREAIRTRNPKHNKPIGGRVARRAAA